jgi:hypothetical protein
MVTCFLWGRSRAFKYYFNYVQFNCSSFNDALHGSDYIASMKGDKVVVVMMVTVVGEQ